MELSIKDLSCGYSSEVLKDLNISFKENTWNFFIGTTGSGKSTFFLTLSKLLPQINGDIFLNGESLKNNNILGELRDNCGIMFQYTEKQFFNSTIKEEILFNLKRREKDVEIQNKKLDEVVELLKLDREFLERSPFEISGGQKRMVALASILITNPTILFLDEPTVGLDLESKNLFFNILKKLKRKGVTIFQVSHFLEDVLEYGDTVTILSSSKANYYTDVNIVLDKEIISDANLDPLERLTTPSDTIERLLEVKNEKI